MADVSVRPARPDDAAEIARIQIETWRHGYADILPQPVLDGLAADSAQAAWSAAITQAPSPLHRVLVATEQTSEQTRTVGFAALAPAVDDDVEGDEIVVAIGPLLVEPRWTRRGHGSRLMAAAVDHARADGMTRAVSWIPEADTVSREFLIGAGWAPDGLVRALETGAGELREVRLRTDLS